MFAVGYPSSLPLWSPEITVPSMRYQWPSICAASSGRPSVMAFLIEVEENIPLLSSIKGAIVTPKSNFSPYSSSIFTEPLLFLPKQKSSPTTTCLTPRPFTRTSFINWSALSEDNAELNCNSYKLLIPTFSNWLARASALINLKGFEVDWK